MNQQTPEPAVEPEASAAETSIPSVTSIPAAPDTLGAGFRFSTYGPAYNPGPDYWVSVGQRMSARFPGSHPEAIWIVGNFTGDGTYLSFNAKDKTEDPFVSSGVVDMNDAMLTKFDQQGIKIWLQVESGNADMVGLIGLVLEQYKHHPCVIGFGVDVEWYKSDGSAEGTPVTDAEAEAWVRAVRAVDPGYLLFLKHWDYTFMPPAYRDGIVFVDDSQQFDNFEHMITEFTEWGQYFAPAKVGYQYGYPDDKDWWGSLQDPPAEIGNAILEKVPNTGALFWVDFTVIEVFPPQ